jgi:hypothetical protein
MAFFHLVLLVLTTNPMQTQSHPLLSPKKLTTNAVWIVLYTILIWLLLEGSPDGQTPG